MEARTVPSGHTADRGVLVDSEGARSQAPGPVRPIMVIHAGAGALSADIREHERQCREFLLEVLSNAKAMLEAGRSALLTVKSAVQIMESFGLFNAGYGSALCSDGSVQMSAALMRGSDRQAGALAGIRTVKHPIIGALSVFERGQVLMIGDAADRLAIEHGAEHWHNEDFVTERQRTRLAARLDDDVRGTVGAVCLDTHGVLAAATSTGGVSGQPSGRVGDSPLIGGGTWADARVAVSCTGEGEAFIRSGAARHIATLVECGIGLEAATTRALADVHSLGGCGGLIALGRGGGLEMPFNTPAMLRAVWRAGDEPIAWVTEPHRQIEPSQR